MGPLSMIRGRKNAPIAQPEDFDNVNEKNGTYSSSDADTLSLEERNQKEVAAHPDQVTADAQLGQQKAEAAALVWSKGTIYAVYVWIWVGFFMLAFQNSVMLNLSPYIFSKTFTAAPAVYTANILAQIIGGVTKLPLAKILNLWGRAEGFCVSICFLVLGVIIIAAAPDPDTYAAGYVIYWIGYDNIYLQLDIFVADTSGMRNRAFAFAFAGTPFIMTAFTGPLAAQAALTLSNYRWGIGLFAIIFPITYLPLAVVFKFYEKKAQKQGLFVRERSGRTTMQSIIYYFHQFDIIGCVILMAAFILFLLPFSLVSYTRLPGYDSAGFIAMVVIGVLLFPTFYVWERYFTTAQFIKWEYVRQRTVLGACVLSAVIYVSFYCWDNQYMNFVRIVFNLDVSNTGYMSQIYNIGSTFFGVIFGLYVYFAKEFKRAALFFALPLYILGTGLTIYFRGQGGVGGVGDIGYVIMCQIFIAFAGGSLVISQQMAVMAASDRESVPLGLALLSLCSNLGGAIGDAIAVAVYQKVYIQNLTEKFPNDPTTVQSIYLTGYTYVFETFPVGSNGRQLINESLGEVQKYLGIAATCFMVLAIPAVAVWKNYRVDRKQNKGTVM